MAHQIAEEMRRRSGLMPVLPAVNAAPSSTRASFDPAPRSPWVVQLAPDQPRLDLGRHLHCLFGLTFDAVTLDEAAQQVRRDANDQRPCFISTPNVNFVVAAQTDAAFRDSVLRSDLSLADGMPIVWAARLMGIPIRQRVAGSDLFDHLHRPGADALKIYFFGGPDGVAERAAGALNAQGGTLRCVGFESPGFGSIADISSHAQIERINASGADFVVVALGAKKGQAWIEHNRHRLTAPLISHLGAVVNFVAGSVNRAPISWQRVGLEWLWRVKEEPSLWRRYFHDGLTLARLAAMRTLPCAAAVWLHRAFGRPRIARLEIVRNGDAALIHLGGDWNHAALASLIPELTSLLQQGVVVRFNLGATTWIDSAVLGLLMQLDRWQDRSVPLVGEGPLSSAVRRLIRWHGAEVLVGP
jgi:N-acetylglucosaminyldiphosphoundecaprenol N-acetyl-beta-D-mannosaminyltransferase